MRVPQIHGIIKRRLLVNFRADPGVVQNLLPAAFKPKIHEGFAIVGICLIRLEKMRTNWVPALAGISSENAAHRIAVTWTDPNGTFREGVYIPRRDTGSKLNHIVGGRLFPGEQNLADFEVADSQGQIRMKIRSRDGLMRVDLEAHEADALPPNSCFKDLNASSAFFESGCVGYSVTSNSCTLDGIRLSTKGWSVRPLEVTRVVSSYFHDPNRFPNGSIAFDHALIMRDLPHQWISEPEIQLASTTT